MREPRCPHPQSHPGPFVKVGQEHHMRMRGLHSKSISRRRKVTRSDIQRSLAKVASETSTTALLGGFERPF
jgi:hypothetical protein